MPKHAPVSAPKLTESSDPKTLAEKMIDANMTLWSMQTNPRTLHTAWERNRVLKIEARPEDMDAKEIAGEHGSDWYDDESRAQEVLI